MHSNICTYITKINLLSHLSPRVVLEMFTCLALFIDNLLAIPS